MLIPVLQLGNFTNNGEEAVSKVLFYPLAPQGGNYKYLYIRKSPLRFREASAKQSWGI
jgi:hypothetical protein